MNKYISISADRYDEIFIKNKVYHWTDSFVEKNKEIEKKFNSTARWFVRCLDER